ncbi:replication initiator protein A [Deinococcus antarcticus]|uniref:Replication initiator protein A n=1 Tax=Deinococcus antarcticus TaxID=1298767 RepID=A0ABV8A421_9DEIO
MTKDRHIVGTDERNLARLAVVIGLNRVPSQLTGWEKNLQLTNGSSVHITCVAGRGHVVPHGVDADIIFSMLTQYLLQGKPRDGQIETTPADICRHCGMTPGSTTYRRIHESLERLAGVRYRTFNAWSIGTKRGVQQWQSNTFGIIDSMTAVGVTEQASTTLGRFTAETVLRLRLSTEIIQSILAGNIRAIDFEFYSKLRKPLTRMLYRTLEEVRQEQPETFVIPLSVWAIHLGMLDIDENHDGSRQAPLGEGIQPTVPLRADKIRRALDPAHEELVSHGYLAEVEYVGVGKNQQVHYRFGAPGVAVDLEVAALLTQRGMSLAIAERHVKKLSRESIEEAVARFDARLTAGYVPKNPGGLLNDMLEHPEKYASFAPEKPRKAPAKSKVIDEPLPQPGDPLETVRVLLKLKLGRAPSPMALDALNQLSPEGIEALSAALKKPKEKALELAVVILGVPL